jgi:hypothetical protein
MLIPVEKPVLPVPLTTMENPDYALQKLNHLALDRVGQLNGLTRHIGR